MTTVARPDAIPSILTGLALLSGCSESPRGGAPADKVATFGESTPMKRPGEPNEVAPCFLFLACDDSSYMSGQVLHPNGGTVVNG